MYVHYTCSTLEQANGKMGIPTELRNCTGSGNGDDCYVVLKWRMVAFVKTKRLHSGLWATVHSNRQAKWLCSGCVISCKLWNGEDAT